MKLSTPPKRYLNENLIYFFLALFGISLGISTICYAQQAKTLHPKHEKVCVQPRQTVWSIVNAEYGDQVDVTYTASVVLKANGIQDARQIQAGQVIELPVVKE